MTRATTAWSIQKANPTPRKLADGYIDLEKSLEDWLESDPDMLEPGMVVLARQLSTEGGPLDLLCLDRNARLVVVELKRDRAYRDALAQVLDYTACVAAMDYGELSEIVDSHRRSRGLESSLEEILREKLGESAGEWTPEGSDPRILLVGTGADASLRRIIDYLTSRFDVPVNGVFFDVFDADDGGTILVRTAVVEDEQAVLQGRRRGRGGIRHEDLLAVAERNGVREWVEPVYETWLELTGREGRPERQEKCWSLPLRSDGRKNCAWLYPWDAEGEKGRCWLHIYLKHLSAETGEDETALRSAIAALGPGVTFVDDLAQVPIADADDARRLTSWLREVYPAPESP